LKTWFKIQWFDHATQTHYWLSKQNSNYDRIKLGSQWFQHHSAL